jgi:hypothetical protein
MSEKCSRSGVRRQLGTIVSEEFLKGERTREIFPKWAPAISSPIKCPTAADPEATAAVARNLKLKLIG